jgi:hypothetical protein
MNPAPAVAGGNTKSAADCRLHLIGPDISIFSACNFPLFLPSKLVRHFKGPFPEIKHEYSLAHRVSFRNSRGNNLEAEIEAIQTYWVLLSFSKGVLIVEFSCPCAGTDFCPHLYAAILMLGRRGFLGAIHENPELKCS